MTYRAIYKNDPWPDECPDPSKLAPRDLVIIIEDWPHANCTIWEMSFCTSILRQLRNGRALSPSQIGVLNRYGFFQRLWNSDPALWDECYVQLESQS